MFTTKIQVKEYLAEYCRTKYSSELKDVVKFPSQSLLVWLIYMLLEKRPTNMALDKGNLEFVIPYSKQKIGVIKNPAVYNYISEKGQKLIQRYLYNEFWLDAITFINTNKLQYGIDYQDSAFLFLNNHNIKSLSVDAVVKKNYRYREEKKSYKVKRESIFC